MILLAFGYIESSFRFESRLLTLECARTSHLLQEVIQSSLELTTLTIEMLGLLIVAVFKMLRVVKDISTKNTCYFIYRLSHIITPPLTIVLGRLLPIIKSKEFSFHLFHQLERIRYVKHGTTLLIKAIILKMRLGILMRLLELLVIMIDFGLSVVLIKLGLLLIQVRVIIFFVHIKIA